MCTYIYYDVTSDKNGKLLLEPEVSALFIAHGELMCAYFELFGLTTIGLNLFGKTWTFINRKLISDKISTSED